jgi:PBSX family phage portal protein
MTDTSHSTALATIDTPQAPAARTEVFTFGDPIPVLDRREFLDYLECVPYGKWYEPPVSLNGLALTFRAAVHHSSPIYVKRNILVRCFKAHPLLSKAAFSGWVLDYLVFGNAYMQPVISLSGRVMRLDHILAKYVRRGKDLSSYWWVQNFLDACELKGVFHLREPDINQEIYGVPEYLSALNSIWLNESATLFRRRYYSNGSHAGFILYMTDAAQDQADVDKMREALKQSKGPGNFRNLFMYAPNGKKDGIQLIPVAEVAAKDDFGGIKNTTRDDQLAAHRVPPQILGVMPNTTGGFGDVEKAAKVFNINEIEPLMARFEELNDWLGERVITFDPYALAVQESGQGAKPQA